MFIYTFWVIQLILATTYAFVFGDLFTNVKRITKLLPWQNDFKNVENDAFYYSEASSQNVWNDVDFP